MATEMVKGMAKGTAMQRDWARQIVSNQAPAAARKGRRVAGRGQ